MGVSLRVLRKIWSRVSSLHNGLERRLYEVLQSILYIYLRVQINKSWELGYWLKTIHVLAKKKMVMIHYYQKTPRESNLATVCSVQVTLQSPWATGNCHVFH